MSSQLKLSDAEVNLANQQEMNERLSAQVKYFSERVVILRALLNQSTAALNQMAGTLQRLDIDIDEFIKDNAEAKPEADSESD